MSSMNSNWFRHDNDAHSDERCAALIARMGYEGYGMLWHLLERMHHSTDGRINLNLLDGIAWDMKVEVAKLKQLLDVCFEVGLFVDSKGFCYSERMHRELQWRSGLIEKRAEAGRKGGLAKAKNQGLALAKQMPSRKKANGKHPTQPNHTQQSLTPSTVIEDGKPTKLAKADVPDMIGLYEAISGRKVVSRKKWESPIKSRLKEFTAEQIEKAWRKMAEDDYLRGRDPRNTSGKDYFTLEYALRANKIDEWLSQGSEVLPEAYQMPEGVDEDVIVHPDGTRTVTKF